MTDLATLLAARGVKSTEESGTIRRYNPKEPSPWESNKSVAKITDSFASEVPTIGEVVMASMAMSTPNPFAIRYGSKEGGDFGQILMGMRANRQQRQNQLQQIMLDQQQHDFAKEKFLYQQQKDAFDLMREMSKQNKEGVGEAYRQAMNILPQLDAASATRFMQNVIDDPEAVDQLPDAQSAYKFMFRNLERAGIIWQEKRGAAKPKVAIAGSKLKSSSTKTMNIGGEPRLVEIQKFSDGKVKAIDSLTGQPVNEGATAYYKPSGLGQNKQEGNLDALRQALGVNDQQENQSVKSDLPIEVQQPSGPGIVSKALNPKNSLILKMAKKLFGGG